MSLISKNVELGDPISLSSWRKVAIGTWKTAGDPSVYGVVELNADAALQYIEDVKNTSGQRITISHFVGRVIAEALARHPEINCILRLGRLYPRKSVDVFFQVASDGEGKDLSGMTIRNADQKSVVDIAKEMEDRVKAIREKGDPAFQKMKKTMGAFPGILAGPLLTLTSFFMYTLNLWTPLLGSPRDPFGSVMITNIGSLGLEMAFAPLVPYSRIPLLIAIGVVQPAPCVVSGELRIANRIRLCVTFDHRLIDGVHASHMANTVREIFRNPEKELGAFNGQA